MEQVLICDMYSNKKTEINKIDYESLISKNIQYIGKKVYAKIDRPLGCIPKKEYPNFVEELNYGFIPNTISGDGEELDCYILGIDKPLVDFEGKCIAVIHRINEDDDKLILVPENFNITINDIKKQVYYSEKYHKSFVYTNLLDIV